MENFNVKKKEQELNRLKRDLQRDTQKERKERTHNLIKKGAMLESFFDIKNLSILETESLLKELAPVVKKLRDQNN
ncbi:MAG: DUF3847 domain-containing protein [Carnobacterium sp.]|nr:DUF3847 domain-containing protein [Carnobacterium sp.]